MELNPHHPTTKAFHDHWHKVCAMLMLKFKSRHVVLTVPDIEAIAGNNIVIEGVGETIHVRLVDDAEAARLAKAAGVVFDS